MPTVYKPTDLDQAMRIVANAESAPVVLAGGTDLYPAHVGARIAGPVLDISRIDSFRKIELAEHEGRQHLRIGAAVKWSAIARRRHHTLNSPAMDCLVMAAREVGGVQIQNLGTVVGNLCNASPAADGVPALQALDASLKLVSPGAQRIVPLTAFIIGPRQTGLQANEIVDSLLIPVPTGATTRSHSMFLKLGHRRFLVISAVMTAVRLDWTDDTVTAAAISVGACGPVASRLPELEQQLCGMSPRQLREFAQQPLASQTLDALSPIEDLRGSVQYRMSAADQLVRRTLLAMAGKPGQQMIDATGVAQ